MDGPPLKSRTDQSFASLCMLVWTEMADDLEFNPKSETMIIVPDTTYSGAMRLELMSMIRAKGLMIYESTTWQVTGRCFRFTIRSVQPDAFRGRSFNNAYMPMGTSIPDSKHKDLSDMWLNMQPLVATSSVKVVEY